MKNLEDRRPLVALLQFPGVNCESETSRALERAGARVRWVRQGERLDSRAHGGFVLPGGFSYEDRVRAGAVASRSPWMEALEEADREGRPILGICNGAQVLVESGLVPHGAGGRIGLALAPNRGSGAGGYLSRWTYVEVRPSACEWLRPLEGTRWPVAVAHGEGCFASRDAEVRAVVEHGAGCALRYVAPDGGPAEGTEWDPNGGLARAAAVCNQRGNALALMPHPERGAWLRQVPEGLPGPWGERRRQARVAAELEQAGPGLALFEAFVRAAASAAGQAAPDGGRP